VSSALSIIIPTLGRESDLAACIESLLPQVGPEDEVIIVLQKAKGSLCCNHQVRTIYANFANLPQARNIGILASIHNYIVFFDDDTVLHTQCLEHHRKFHARHNHEIMAGRVKLTAGNQWNTPGHMRIDPHTSEVYANFDMEKQGEVLYACGCHFSLSKKLIQTVGWFNPHFI